MASYDWLIWIYEDQSGEAGKIARSRQFTGQINPTLLTVSNKKA